MPSTLLVRYCHMMLLYLQSHMPLYSNGMRYESLEWIDLAHDRDRWQVLLNAVTNF
jgi:hypothetical protein